MRSNTVKLFFGKENRTEIKIMEQDSIPLYRNRKLEQKKIKNKIFPLSNRIALIFWLRTVCCESFSSLAISLSVLPNK